MSACSVSGCELPVKTKEYCLKHYKVWWRTGDATYKRITIAVCSIEGCGKKHDSKGYCHEHYKRWKAYGDPLVVKQQRGNVWIENGYRVLTVDGRTIAEHRLIAERALGRSLPRGAEVHHVDENPLNNEPTNLVICPSLKYHKLLHIRTDALNACGNANWRKCPFCKSYDDIKNMRDERVRFVHVACANAAKRIKREKARVSA